MKLANKVAWIAPPSHIAFLGKLVNQTILAVTIGAVAEGLLLAKAGGADPAQVRKAILGGFCQSRVLEEHGQRMIDRNFVPGGAVSKPAEGSRRRARSSRESPS
jgi:2-hydroxy-3-oxopropionate reductase